MWQCLADNAAYLAQLGQQVTDMSDLWWFEVKQAFGFHQPSLSEVTTDSRLSTPGLPLDFEIYYSGCLLGRNTATSMGRGWFHSWSTTLEAQDDGTIVITTSRGAHRRFQPDIRGGYISPAGDEANLELLPGGGFVLRESDGLLTGFRSDGRLDYWEDTNGNRITAGYTEDLLTSLTHSSGQYITLAYTADGYVETVTDSAGRVTTFTYEGDLLTSFVDTTGQATSYTYQTEGTPQQIHALLSVERAGESWFYTYDERGRVIGSTINDGALPQTVSYNTTGKVTVTDSVGGTTDYFYDHRYLLAAVKDRLSNFTWYSYDQNMQTIAVTDAIGQEYGYQYDTQGNLTQVIDPLGNTTAFDYSGPYNRMSLSTDANGNTIEYGYDARAEPGFGSLSGQHA